MPDDDRFDDDDDTRVNPGDYPIADFDMPSGCPLEVFDWAVPRRRGDNRFGQRLTDGFNMMSMEE